jgi:hypothetical protein
MEIGFAATIRAAYREQPAWVYHADLALIRDAWGDEGVALADAYARAEFDEAAAKFARFVAYVAAATP